MESASPNTAPGALVSGRVSEELAQAQCTCSNKSVNSKVTLPEALLSLYRDSHDFFIWQDSGEHLHPDRLCWEFFSL